jgi:predicted membrane protein
MPPLQFLGYSALIIVGLYLAYVVSTTLIGLLWYLAKIVIYGTLLAFIVWFLYRQGFFEFLKKKFK